MTSLIVILTVVFFILLFLTFRSPGAPSLFRLVTFLALLAVTVVLVFQFAVRFLGWNPNPSRVRLAHELMQDKFIDFLAVAPGVFDLNYVHLIDTDVPQPTPVAQEDTADQEWLVFYQFDVVDPNTATPQGPYGGAIYGLINCRPPSVLSYELASVGYGYLGEDSAEAQVANIIEYKDPLSVANGEPLDRPEVLVTGYSRGAATDLNIFRKVGVQLNCLQQRQWRSAHPGEAFPNPIRFENVGSFHGSYLIKRNGATVQVYDRDGFERSQIVSEKRYRPDQGSYFRPGTQELIPPYEYGLVFGPGEPAEVTQSYYPEKAVLAFYLALGQDATKLQQAGSYLSTDAQGRYDLKTDSFGVALARSDLSRVRVLKITYVPDAQAEQLRQPRPVEVEVVGVDSKGNVDWAHRCRVSWRVVGVPNDKAIPYGCEWRLDRYEVSCAP